MLARIDCLISGAGTSKRISFKKQKNAEEEESGSKAVNRRNVNSREWYRKSVNAQCNKTAKPKRHSLVTCVFLQRSFTPDPSCLVPILLRHRRGKADDSPQGYSKSYNSAHIPAQKPKPYSFFGLQKARPSYTVILLHKMTKIKKNE